MVNDTHSDGQSTSYEWGYIGHFQYGSKGEIIKCGGDNYSYVNIQFN